MRRLGRVAAFYEERPLPKIAKPADNLPSNNRRLISLAQKLFGQFWRRPLARMLDVHQNQAHRWVKGESEVQDVDLKRLRDYAKQHAKDILKEVG